MTAEELDKTIQGLKSLLVKKWFNQFSRKELLAILKNKDLREVFFYHFCVGGKSGKKLEQASPEIKIYILAIIKKHTQKT
jgi:hypothetical protein